MIDSILGANAPVPAPTARAASTKANTSEGGFAAELSKAEKKTPASQAPATQTPAAQAPATPTTPATPTDTKTDTKAEDAPKGEKTEAVAGHHYAEIVDGPRNGMFINTSGNERDGDTFLIVKRAGRTFHVYGTGADRVVVEPARADHDDKPAAAGVKKTA